MATFFDLRHTQTLNSIIIFYCVFCGTENVLLVITFEIVLLSCILADIRVITLFQPPSLISAFRFRLGVLLIAPLKSLTLKTSG